MTEITVQMDPRNLRRLSTLAGVSRVMAAKALTFTAERAVPAWVGGHRVFTKRRSWIDKGVRMRGATAGNLNARVGTIDRWMGRHVVGIGEEKRTGGRALFVPNAPAPAQGTHTQTRRKLKAMRRTKRGTFWKEGLNGDRRRPSGPGDVLLRRKGKSRLPLIVLGRARRSVDIPERLDALGIVSGVVHREFPPIYERLLLRWAETGRG